MGNEDSNPEPSQPEPLDRDERIKIDLPFEEAIRALLKAVPPENREREAEKEPGPPTPRKS